MTTYEDFAVSALTVELPVPVLEAYQGEKIVAWYGAIERQLEKMLKDAEAAQNWPYADKVRKYLELWRSNPITGSLNVETLEVLKSPLEVMAVDSWNLANYFGNLRDRLRQLIASEEELPRMPTGEESPLMGTRGGRGGAPPIAPTFGPEPTAGGPKPPGEEEVPPGEAGPPGAAPEAPGGGPVRRVAGRGAPVAAGRAA
jgi:hypothetical protein